MGGTAAAEEQQHRTPGPLLHLLLVRSRHEMTVASVVERPPPPSRSDRDTLSPKGERATKLELTLPFFPKGRKGGRNPIKSPLSPLGERGRE